jgi:Pectate lyase superfamily protein/Periplasmic copper-binding protein (NosD)
MSDRASRSDLTQREFLKRLAGTAAGVAGFAAASRLLTSPTVEAAYDPGMAPDGGDLVDKNLWVTGTLYVKGGRPWLDVCAYGAKGDGVTDDTAAVQSAFDAVAPASTATVFFPPGRYRLTAPITCANRHLCVMGGGRGVTDLHFDINPGGFQFAFDDPGYRLTMQALSIRTSVVQAGIAIQAAWPWPGNDGRNAASPHFVDFEIGPVDATGSWTKGIELTNARGVKIEQFDIRGKTGLPGMTHAIHLLGHSSKCHVESGLIVDTAYGVNVSEQSEHVYISHVDALYTYISFFIDSYGRGAAISHCHSTSEFMGICVQGHRSLAVTNNLVLQYSGIQFVGIYLFESPHCRIVGNEIGSVNPSGFRRGILLNGGTQDCTIEGNVVSDMSTGIAVGVYQGGGDDRNIVTANRVKNCPTGIVDGGVGNLVVNNHV